MISPNIINSIGSSVVWEMTVTNGPVLNTGVFVDLTIPSEFTIISSTYIKGSLSGMTWTIGDMDVNETQKLIVVLQLTGTPASFSETFDFVADVNGLDTIESNNVLTDILQYQVISTEPLAGAVPDESACLCVDVSQNDTPCSQGTTEWRLDESSIVNGVLQSWDVLTGQGHFTPIDPTQSITFEYDLFCVSGGDEYEIACDVEVEIYPQLFNVDVFDHIIEEVLGPDLGPGGATVIQAQYPDMTIQEVVAKTWFVIRNKDGIITSGVQKPTHKELSGYLCSGEDTVFVWNIDGEPSFKLTDGTDFLGDPLSLKDCCCSSDSVCIPILMYDGTNIVNSAQLKSCLEQLTAAQLDGELTFEYLVNGQIETRINFFDETISGVRQIVIYKGSKTHLSNIIHV